MRPSQTVTIYVSPDTSVWYHIFPNEGCSAIVWRDGQQVSYTGEVPDSALEHAISNAISMGLKVVHLTFSGRNGESNGRHPVFNTITS